MAFAAHVPLVVIVLENLLATQVPVATINLQRRKQILQDSLWVVKQGTSMQVFPSSRDTTGSYAQAGSNSR
jgi:hypothetical protein